MMLEHYKSLHSQGEQEQERIKQAAEEKLAQCMSAKDAIIDDLQQQLSLSTGRRSQVRLQQSLRFRWSHTDY